MNSSFPCSSFPFSCAGPPKVSIYRKSHSSRGEGLGTSGRGNHSQALYPPPLLSMIASLPTSVPITSPEKPNWKETLLQEQWSTCGIIFKPMALLFPIYGRGSPAPFEHANVSLTGSATFRTRASQKQNDNPFWRTTPPSLLKSSFHSSLENISSSLEAT